MNVIEAVKSMQNGSDVVRSSWKDQDSTLYIDPLGFSKRNIFGEDTTIGYDFSIDDILADDWIVVEKK